MSNSLIRLVRNLSLLIIIFLSFIGSKAFGQSRFPAILLGEGTLDEITQLPGYPTSDFVAVQFCGLRGKCTVTTYYVDKLKQQGIDISFFPVFDQTQESMISMSDNFPVKATIDWGLHVTGAAADQVYILNTNKSVIYQGTLKPLDGKILKEIKASSVSPTVFSNLINQQPSSPGNSAGNWLYQGYLYPMNITVADFLKIAVRGRYLIYDKETGMMRLTRAQFMRGQLISSLLTELDLTPITEKGKKYSITVDGVNTSSVPIQNDKKADWQKVLDKINSEQIIHISNFNNLPASLSNKFTNKIDENLSPGEIIEQLRANGLEFNIESTEDVNLLKIQAL